MQLHVPIHDMTLHDMTCETSLLLNIHPTLSHQSLYCTDSLGLAFAYDPDGYWVELIQRGGISLVSQSAALSSAEK